jgi:hypothetical protein
LSGVCAIAADPVRVIAAPSARIVIFIVKFPSVQSFNAQERSRFMQNRQSGLRWMRRTVEKL